jgi:hypothetical protein
MNRKMMKGIKWYLLILCNFFSWFSYSQIPENWEVLGQLKVQSTKQIKTSRWSIGGETLDRDYANYHSYKLYLDSLGAKRIRLQGGWAKTEQVKGKYDFTWLDRIVDDALARGVQTWLQVSYGNPIYEGGGEAALAGGIPTSPEALAAWDKWVQAMVSRYKSKVKEWEIWNEPDISKKFTAQDFADFHVRTSDIIEKEQPGAKIIALGLAGLGRTEYVQSILDILKSKNRLNQFDVLSYHGYRPRPEDHYPQVEELKALVKSYNPDIELWQGENGAPSTKEGEAVGALTRGHSWSELTQAKWDLRRMLGDMAHEVDVTSIFQISDMYYDAGDHMVGLNSKGLLKARPDKTIERPKMSYYAYQAAANLFSGEVTKLNGAKFNHQQQDLSAYAYRKKGSKGSAITLWFSEAKPAEEYPAKKVDFSVSGVAFSSPVLVDLLTGKVYTIPKDHYQKSGNDWKFTGIPVTDSPVVIANKSWVKLR